MSQCLNIPISHNRQIVKSIVVNGGSGGFKEYPWFLAISYLISQYLNMQIAKLIVVDGGAGGFKEYPWFLAIFYSMSQYLNISIGK